MRWFGESWGAPVCESTKQAQTPLGKLCAHQCGHSIRPGDAGLLIPYSSSCLISEIEPMLTIIDDRPHLAYHLVCFFDEIGIRGKTHI
jgi:hypothetical protein